MLLGGPNQIPLVPSREPRNATSPTLSIIGWGDRLTFWATICIEPGRPAANVPESELELVMYKATTPPVSFKCSPRTFRTSPENPGGGWVCRATGTSEP